MAKVRLVRIEHQRGHGPYVGGRGMNEAYGECGYAVPEAWRLDSRHPSPLIDPGICEWWRDLNPQIASEYLFGFADEAQMREWVHYPEVMATLASYGYVLAEYECAERYVRKGAKQVVFNTHRAKRVGTRPLVWA